MPSWTIAFHPQCIALYQTLKLQRSMFTPLEASCEKNKM
jgi:hypothetical protein